jgi:hypothetical protein
LNGSRHCLKESRASRRWLAGNFWMSWHFLLSCFF